MARGATLVLLLAAAFGWLGLVAPARRARDRAWADYARIRQDRERLRSELAGREGRTRPSPAPAGEAAAGRALRLTLLRATEGLRVEVALLSATGARGGSVAHGRLTAEGELADLLLLAERLVDPALGLRIDKVVLAGESEAAHGQARLDLDGSSVGSGS